MERWGNYLIPIFFFAVACVLLWTHSRTWQASRDLPDPEERDYRHRQYRRRMQTSGLLAGAAVALLVGQWIPETVPRTFRIIFWGGVVLVVFWVILLALADIVAIYHYYGRLRTSYLVERAKLQAQLRRVQAARGNGQDKPSQLPAPENSSKTKPPGNQPS
ncbi:MAG: hypothetical protein NZ602_15975 [Thermoguttaceae bacterium]|nr:hypothetical protein [Thermoguttaceae bacterium]MDW8036828.1 hypothetical protein [Thermoguttaceae bacterium]